MKTESNRTADVKVEAIAPGGTNPRKAFDPAAMAELVESVKQHGVLQPVLLRPWPAEKKPPKGTAPQYELVAGERRWRAATTAGLVEIPALVRDLMDAEALEIQVIENLQRSDLHPLEEAEGYEQLMKVHSYTAEDLAAKVGKSKGYVYARLKLCALVPEARKAFHEGKLNPSTALLVARIPVPDLQKRATKEITEPSWSGEVMSVRTAAEHLQRYYMLRLAEAPWPTADAQLVPAAGACTTCPKRTGNQRELFSDVKSADVCTDPSCFDQKRAAWQVRMRAEADAAGREVITGKQAKAIKPHENSSYMSGYIRLSDPCYEDPKSRTYQVLLGKAASAAALLEDPKTKELVPVMPRAAVTKALKEKGYSWANRAAAAKSSRPSTSPAGDSWKAQQKREAAARERWKKAKNAIAAAVAAAVKKASATRGILAEIVLEACSFDAPDDVKAAVKLIPRGTTAEDLIRHAAFLILAGELDNDYAGSRGFERRAKDLGLDLKAILDQAAPVEKPASAARAAKPKASAKKAKRTKEEAKPAGAKAPKPKTAKKAKAKTAKRGKAAA